MLKLFNAVSVARLFPGRFSLLWIPLGLFLCACGEQTQDAVAESPEHSGTATAPLSSAPTPATGPTLEKGVYFKPDLTGFVSQDEYQDDGDGDGVKETHVQRYANSDGDTAFSMTTGDRLWAWSLDTKAGDDSDVRKNYVARDSNCDGVFDERYSLNAEFRVPECLAESGAAGP